MKRNLVVLGAAALVLTSCGMFAKKEYYGARTQNVHNQTIYTTPMVADIDVNINKKIEGYAEDKDLTSAKGKARQDALTKSGADVLVDPVFTYTQKGFGKFKVNVQGYYGKYKEVRPMDLPDSLIYRMGSSKGNASLEVKGGKSPVMKFSRK